jgi:hypothetical protein
MEIIYFRNAVFLVLIYLLVRIVVDFTFKCISMIEKFRKTQMQPLYFEYKDLIQKHSDSTY